MNWEKPLIALLAPLVVLSQQAVDRDLGGFRAQHETLYLWSGEQIKRLAPGFEDILADVYWLRTVQYFGGQRAYAEGRSFELLRAARGHHHNAGSTVGHRVQVRRGLPCRAQAYRCWRSRQAASRFSEGSGRKPVDWRLRQDLGFFHFLYLQDGAGAARILNEAARNEPERRTGCGRWPPSSRPRAGNAMPRASMWQAMAAQSERWSNPGERQDEPGYPRRARSKGLPPGSREKVRVHVRSAAVSRLTNSCASVSFAPSRSIRPGYRTRTMRIGSSSPRTRLQRSIVLDVRTAVADRAHRPCSR